MLYRVTLCKTLVLTLFFGNLKGLDRKDISPVLVQINPFISNTKKIIQFKGDGRYKRGGLEKSSLFLEFPESFFSDPKLKRLYTALVGGSNSRKTESDETNIVFKLDPSGFEEEEKVVNKARKREVSAGQDDVAFELRIAPSIPRRQPISAFQFTPMASQTANLWCVEQKPETTACKQLPLCATSTQETGCYPSKPNTPILRICGGTTQVTDSGIRQDPCACASTEVSTESTKSEEEFMMCKSSPPVVTHDVSTTMWTTEPCRSRTPFRDYARDLFSTSMYAAGSSTISPATGRLNRLTTPPALRIINRRLAKRGLRKHFRKGCSPSCPTTCSTTCPTTCSTTSPTTCPTITTTTRSTTCSSATTCSTTCPYVSTCFTFPYPFPISSIRANQVHRKHHFKRDSCCRTTCPSTCSTACPTTCRTACTAPNWIGERLAERGLQKHHFKRGSSKSRVNEEQAKTVPRNQQFMANWMPISSQRRQAKWPLIRHFKRGCGHSCTTACTTKCTTTCPTTCGSTCSVKNRQLKEVPLNLYYQSSCSSENLTASTVSCCPSSPSTCCGATTSKCTTTTTTTTTTPKPTTHKTTTKLTPITTCPSRCQTCITEGISILCPKTSVCTSTCGGKRRSVIFSRFKRLGRNVGQLVLSKRANSNFAQGSPTFCPLQCMPASTSASTVPHCQQRLRHPTNRKPHSPKQTIPFCPMQVLPFCPKPSSPSCPKSSLPFCSPPKPISCSPKNRQSGCETPSWHKPPPCCPITCSPCTPWSLPNTWSPPSTRMTPPSTTLPTSSPWAPPSSTCPSPSSPWTPPSSPWIPSKCTTPCSSTMPPCTSTTHCTTAAPCCPMILPPNSLPALLPSSNTRNCLMKRPCPNEPLKDLYQFFRQKQKMRHRRNPTPFRKKRRIWVYKPKHGLRKIYLRAHESPNII